MSEFQQAEIRLAHASSLGSMESRHFVEDLRATLDDRPLVASFTEVSGRRTEIRETLEGTGYRPLFHRSRETCFVYHHASGVRVKDSGEVSVSRKTGDYPSRSITFGLFEYRDLDFWYHTAHWLAHLSDSPARVRDHNKMTKEMVGLVTEHGEGRALSFFSGDANENDRPREDRALGHMNSSFRAGGLETIWDEKNRYPGTFAGRPIDIIGSYVGDRRVRAEKVWVRDQNADHHRLVVDYGVDAPR